MQDTPVTVSIDKTLNVARRLEELKDFEDEWLRQDKVLQERLYQLDMSKPLDTQRGAQIASLRRRLYLQLVKEPLEISPQLIEDNGYPALRATLVNQFTQLSDTERFLWLNNFLFIMTPDLRKLSDKVGIVRGYRALGQQRCFLLGGESGMGKTTYLNWYVSNYIQHVERERNRVPIVKVDAPVTNHTPKPLLRRIIRECGLNYLRSDDEDTLLEKIATYFDICGVEMLIIDEVEHIIAHSLRRRVLEISNIVRGVPIVCASCNPYKWAEGDPEVEGRWNDYFPLAPYTGERLEALLAFLELLLPLPSDSHLPLRQITIDTKKRETIPGPAQLIEEKTKGVLRNIMILILDASMSAIRQGLPNLSINLLEDTWKNIQTQDINRFKPPSLSNL